MIKEEIIEMAEQSGFMFTDGSPIGFTYSMLEDFAKLVKEKERTWVGLTDEDIQKLAAEQHDWESLYLAVQDKLKEKNS